MKLRLFKIVFNLLQWLLLVLILITVWLIVSSRTVVFLAEIIENNVPELSIEGISGRLTSRIHIHKISYQTKWYRIDFDDVAFGFNWDEIYQGNIKFNDISYSNMDIEPYHDGLKALALYRSQSLSEIRIQSAQWQWWNKWPNVEIDLYSLGSDDYYHGTININEGKIDFLYKKLEIL